MSEQKLQRLIDAAANANTKSYLAVRALNDYCDKTYGVCPSDVGEDYIIDQIYGGCGVSGTMSAKEFDSIMSKYKASQ